MAVETQCMPFNLLKKVSSLPFSGAPYTDTMPLTAFPIEFAVFPCRWRTFIFWSRSSSAKEIMSITHAIRMQVFRARSDWLPCEKSSPAKRCVSTMPCATPFPMTNSNAVAIHPTAAGRSPATTGKNRIFKSVMRGIFHRTYSVKSMPSGQPIESSNENSDPTEVASSRRRYKPRSTNRIKMTSLLERGHFSMAQNDGRAGSAVGLQRQPVKFPIQARRSRAPS